MLAQLIARSSAVAATLILCASSVRAEGEADADRSGLRERLECARSKAFRLQIIHSSDNESSFQDPNTLEEKILNYAAITEGLEIQAERECLSSIHITAGDHTIPGPFYQASEEVPALGEPGLADIVMYNAMRVRANGMGNHEFDGGIDEFAFMLDRARYPFIAANLDFSQVVLDAASPSIRIGKDGARCRPGEVVKSCFIVVGGVRYGLIGRAPADFFNVIENPPVTIPGLDFVGGRDPATNQPLVSAVGQVLEQVDLLKARGINRIILIDHAQDFTGDPLSANLLRDIDIIVAAGSTGFMAGTNFYGPFNLLRPEDRGNAPYPVIRTDSQGHQVLVINSDQQYRYVGVLIVDWDAFGNIEVIDKRSGPIATTPDAIVAFETFLGKTLSPPPLVSLAFQALQNTPLIQSAFAVVGQTTSPLNGLRADVRTRETNLGRVAADSTLWYAQTSFPALGVDVALKNGGGIRDSITGPQIIRLTIQAALAFDNRLGIIEMTGAQLLAAMENSVSRFPAADGRFPQIAGMILEFDPTRPGIQGQVALNTPSRVRSLIITRSDGTTDTLVSNYTAQGDLSRTFVMATNSFLTTGGDGYASFTAARPLAVTAVGEQAILEDYIRTFLGGVVDVPEPLTNLRVVQVP